ncbi:MAG: sugar transferase [Paludibacteraceae bacterium]|nr:sugar transferase [Paludibacteraceae bacterium]
MKRLFYRPYWRYAIADAVALLLSVLVVLAWFPLSTSVPFQKYSVFATIFALMWLVSSYLCHRYIPVKYMKMGKDIRRLIAASILIFAGMSGYMYLMEGKNFSIWVLLTLWLAMMGISLIFLIFKHAYRYALDADEEVVKAPKREPQTVLKPAEQISQEDKAALRESILEFAPDKVLRYIEKNIDIFSTNTFTLRSTDIYNIRKLPNYRFDAIVNFMPLNQIRGVNKLFTTVNDKLPDNGIWVCCYEPQSVTKRNILKRYPLVIGWLYYAAFFCYKRVLPKLFMTSRLYFDITEGKNRVLSKAEVLGRLCYCGFEIIDERKKGDLNYVVARRKFRPEITARRLYGILVKLNRVGKNGKMFKVYKFRTMHPYSEFLQAYIYERYSLQEGGKFNHDIRVTTLGRILRKYWLDELPMMLNLIKGNMKLVGVRPISQHYFSLYSQELQDKRTKHKPGLLPPFYADMPKTLPEIEASEMRYLTMCEQKGTLKTDFIYFWKIFYTIVFKRARSH